MSHYLKRDRHAPLAGMVIGLILALLALGPAVKRGFLLSYDMVFVPHLALSPRTLGVDGSVPRAVPNDAVVAVLSAVLPGDVVQKSMLLSVFVLFGLGLGLVFKEVPATVVAVVIGLWNPWVAQRLEVGHWGFLLGYAALPWVVWAAQNCRKGTPYAYTSLSIVMLLAGLTGSTGIVLALIVLTGVLLGEAPRLIKPYLFAVLVAFLVSATWLWPFLNASSRAADPAGATAFAARADTPWGVVISVATGGGSWNQSSWYPERQSWILSAAAFAIVVVAVVALYRLARPGDGLRGVFLAGVLSLVLATAAALPGGREVITFLVTHVPGAGLLRDSQKFAGPWMLSVAVGAGLLTTKLCILATARGWRTSWLAIAAGAVVPVVLLPSLAWGSGGSWQAVSYPKPVQALAQELDQADAGSVAVFPWIQYRRFDWNQSRIMLDPWNRLLSKDVIVNDGLPLRDGLIAGEDPRAIEISRVISSQEHVVPALRSLGVRHVLVLDDQPNQDITSDRLLGAALVKQVPGVQWWDLGVPTADSENDIAWPMLGWYLAGFALVFTVFAWRRETREKKM